MPTHVSAAHAARMYGRSEKTVRRWIAAGKLPAEKVEGAYLVDLDAVARLAGGVSAPTSVPLSAQGVDTVSTQGADDDVRTDEGDVRPTQLAQAEALTSLVQATVATVLGPLVAELAASRQTVERQAEQLVAQAETIGRLTERLESATHAESPVAGRETAPGPETALESSTRRSWASRYGLVVLAVIVVVLLMAGLTLSSGWR